jgi:hypothetical protein
MLTPPHEARRIAANIAKLPELLKRRPRTAAACASASAASFAGNATKFPPLLGKWSRVGDHAANEAEGRDPRLAASWHYLTPPLAR